MSARAVIPGLPVLGLSVLLLSACGKTGDAPGEADVTAAAPAAVAGETAPSVVPPVAAAPVKLAALDSVGEARVGEVFVAADWLQSWTGEGRHPDVDCEYFTGGVLPPGVSMMVMEGRIARFDVHDRDTRVVGPYGLHAGMARAAVEQAMPAGYEVTPHAYGGPEDVYLTWRQPGTGMGLRVEISEGVADALLWGDAHAVTLIEGCS